MAQIPQPPRKDSPRFDDWVFRLWEAFKSLGGSDAADHAQLSNLNSANYSHLTSSQKSDLTDSGDSTLHYHATDRRRSNHTGTQSAATISDFEASVLSIVGNTTDHSLLQNTEWTSSGHTGTVSTIPGFNSSGEAEELARTGTGSVVLNSAASVGGVWTAASAWTLPAFTLGGTVTSNGQSFSGTIANLGTITTADINGGTIDGVALGGSSAVSLGTPSSGDLTNCTGLAVGGITGLGANVATFLATPSSANLAAAVTGETGTGALVFATSPTFGGTIGLGTAPTSSTGFRMNSITLTAAAGAADGIAIFSGVTLAASANNDVLRALTFNPTFSDGAFTGVKHFGLYVTSTASNYFNGSVGVGMEPSRKLDVTGTFGATGAATLGSTLDVTGAVTGSSSIADSKGDVRNIPQNSQSTAYTLVLGDAGKHILHPSADTTARTFTIPANASVAFPVGTAVTFVNQNAAGTLTIAITTDTMRLAGAGTTGSRTLAANGIATALKVTTTEWIISGTNLT